MRTLTVLMLTVAAYAIYDGAAAAGTEIDIVKGICAAIMLVMPVPFLLK